MKIKNKVNLSIFVLLCILIIVILISTFGFIVMSNKIISLSSKMNIMEQERLKLGSMVHVYTVTSDARHGKLIEPTDIVPISIPSACAKNMVFSPTELIGKYFKIDVKAGDYITKSMLMNTKVSDDARLLDVVCDVNPIGLKVGDFVDIKITLPMGESFIAIQNKRVNSYNSGVLKLELSELEQHVYDSLLIDEFMHPGTIISSVQRVPNSVQMDSTVDYPLTQTILAVANSDPNLLQGIKTDMLQRRQALDATLEKKVVSQESLTETLVKARIKYADKIKKAEKEYNAMLNTQ